MSRSAYLIPGYLLSIFCTIDQSPVYGQKIQEVHVESADPGAAPLSGQRAALDLALIEKQIFVNTNKFRVQEKCAPLKSNAELAAAAREFAEYLASTDKFSHTADGLEPWDRTAKAGYKHCIVLENIAYESNSAGFTADELANDLVRDWENSPGHRKNLLDTDVLDIGIGLARSARTGRYYAVQDFGRPKSATITFKVFDGIDTPVKFIIDGQEMMAEPGYTITFERCRPPELRFSWDEKANVTQAGKNVFRPTNGIRYSVRMTEGNAITVEDR